MKNEEKVHLFSTNENYASYWHCMVYLLDSFGKNHWCMVVDIDELFTFPKSESLTLKELKTFFESEKVLQYVPFY